VENDVTGVVCQALSLGGDEKFGDDEVKMAMEVLDANGSGTVNLEEFTAWFTGRSAHATGAADAAVRSVAAAAVQATGAVDEAAAVRALAAAAAESWADDADVRAYADVEVKTEAAGEAAEAEEDEAEAEAALVSEEAAAEVMAPLDIVDVDY